MSRAQGRENRSSPSRRGVIVHVYNFMHPEYGGPPHVILQLARAQMRLGFEVRLVASDLFDQEVYSSIRSQLPYVPPRYPLTPRFFWPMSSKALIDTALRDATAVHLHSIWPTPCLYVSHRCRSLKIPYVLSVHGHLRAEAIGLKSIKKRVGLRLGYRGMLEGAAAFHVLNHSEREEVIEFGLSSPTYVIPNGLCAVDYQAPPPRAVIEELISALKGRPYLLFLSRIHPRKGASHLAEAFCRLADEYPTLQLVVAGVDHGGAQEVRELIQRHRLSHRVHLPGFLSGQVKASAFVHAQAFCLPSFHEGFSVAALEALAWGTPTILSSGCHFNELETHRAGWIHQIGVEPLIHTLKEVLEDPVKTKERAEHGRRWVLAHYEWEVLNQLHLQIYAEINPHFRSDFI